MSSNFNSIAREVLRKTPGNNRNVLMDLVTVDTEESVMAKGNTKPAKEKKKPKQDGKKKTASAYKASLK